MNHSQVAAKLEEDIIFGRLRPRERLIEDALMARFEVKRHVVRQALADLDKLGIVARERNRGALVRYFTPDEVENIYEVRGLLQQRAAQRIPLPASAELLARLEEIHRRHVAAVQSGDLKAVYDLNNDFHDAVFGTCGNPYLFDAISHYAALSHAIRSYRIADPILLQQACEEHAEIIGALRNGDRRRLVRLCVDHIKPSKEAYLRTAAWEASVQEAVLPSPPRLRSKSRSANSPASALGRTRNAC